MENIVDLHSHILPNCDDGPRNLLTALKLSQQAVNQGINKMLLTPHHMDAKYINHKADVIKKTNQFQIELKHHNIPLRVYPGQEVHLTGNLLKAIDDDDILFADSNHHYLMLELPTTEIPAYAYQVLFQLKIRGITPIIVHPERNQEFIRYPDELYEFMNKGYLTQMTASSYMGNFGKKIQRFSEQIIDSGLCNIVSSDAHNLNHRNFQLDAFYDKLLKNKGSKLSFKYNDNAKNILLGHKVTNSNFTMIPKNNNFRNLINKLFY